MSDGLGKESDGLKKVSDCLKKVSGGFRDVSDCLGKVSDWPKKIALVFYTAEGRKKILFYSFLTYNLSL